MSRRAPRPYDTPRAFAVQLLLWLAVPIACAAQLAAQAGAAFSADEIARLQAGKPITRPLQREQDGLRLIGGSSWRTIDRPPEVVWQALHDFARYPQMMPRVLAAREVRRSGDERLVFVHNGAWPISTQYYVIMHSDAATLTLSFRLDRSRPHGIRECWGFVRLIPFGPGQTLMAFAALADPGRGIVAAVGRPIVQKTMLMIPSTVKAYLERDER